MIMKYKPHVNILILFYILGGVIASGMTFISVPLGIHFLGAEKFVQLSLWALFLIIAQIFDFGLGQSTIRQCSTTSILTEKTALIQENSKILLLIIGLLIVLVLLVPKPEGAAYDNISFTDWSILKVAMILNVKVIFNQSVFAILNKQLYYTIFQVLMAVARFIVPIFIYYYFLDFTVVTLYLLISSIIVIIVTDIHVGIKSFDALRFSDLFQAFMKNVRWSFLLYLSTMISISLAVLDRFIASFLLDSNDYATYFGTFALASAVNIAILPFYRIFIASLKNGYAGFNRNNALRITNIQSYICLVTIAFLILYSDIFFQIIGMNFEADKNLLIIISMSLWGAANGWILATDIMLSRKPTIQAWLILSAITSYLLYLSVQSTVSTQDLSIVWVVHGLIQTFICPIWMKESFSWKSYMIWIKHVVLIPFMVTASIFLLCYFFIDLSYILSFLLFTISVIILFFAVAQRSLFNGKAARVRNLA